MPSNARGNRKERVGVVISDKMDKTVTVRVDWVAHHPVYKKLVRRATKFKAHDEKESASMGDTVRIRETRPLSKTKRWVLVDIVKKASSAPAIEIAEESAPKVEATVKAKAPAKAAAAKK
jgi:small subunit ribosomal protein S17